MSEEGDGVAPSKYADLKGWSAMFLIDTVVIISTARRVGREIIGVMRGGTEEVFIIPA